MMVMMTATMAYGSSVATENCPLNVALLGAGGVVWATKLANTPVVNFAHGGTENHLIQSCSIAPVSGWVVILGSGA